MTENQNGKVDPVAIRELISQGIPMKRKESEMSVVLIFGVKKKVGLRTNKVLRREYYLQ